jgi:hypothetical protein
MTTRAPAVAMHRPRPICVAMIALAFVGHLGVMNCQAASAQIGMMGEQGLLCRDAIRRAETGSALPPHLMSAIARVESGRADPATGRVHPWPWTINAEGQGSFFETKVEAIAFARQLLARGVPSIDVGCMQINLMYHPDAFPNLETAFDPVSNAQYALKFLTQLKEKTGSWEMASAWYHSANPGEGSPYRDKVVTVMASEANGPASYGAPATTAVMAWPIAARPSMAGGRGGSVIMLPGVPSGAMPMRLNPMVARLNGAFSASTLPPGATTESGRGLDAYRTQPVRITKSSFIAER